MNTTIAQSDPWQEYQEYPSKGKGKGKGHPKVPESSAYGLIFFVLLVVLCVWMRRRK